MSNSSLHRGGRTPRNAVRAVLLSILIGACQILLFTPLALAVDTDGDGLLDLLDLPEFDPSARGHVEFTRRFIEDLDGATALTNAQVLWLEDNRITSLERGDFEGLDNLQSLSLHKNRIASLERGDFEGLANLISLGLSANQIRSLEPGGFEGLANLQYLYLWGNSIGSLEGGDFEGLANLRELYLSGNAISSLEPGDFEGLAKLQYIELYENPIRSLERGDFEGLANLDQLSLSRSLITSLERGGFEGLVNLRRLRLFRNQITSVERGAFEGLANLQRLELDKNQITSLERGDFEGLANVQWLRLDDNQITSLEWGAFEGLANLQELYLGDNSISRLGGGAFRGLTKLEELNLYDNSISRLGGGAFHGLTNLRTLNLWNNRMTELDLSGATFERLEPCDGLRGFCIDSNISGLILDGAELSGSSFDLIIHATKAITDVSLVALSVADANPTRLSRLLGIDSLDHVTVDAALHSLYANELNAFAAIDGNTVTVVPGLCDVNRDGTCDVGDLDTMNQMLREGIATLEQRTELIESPVPDGFNTYLGDANLDGEFDSGDLVFVAQAAEYEDHLSQNSGWATGDWNGDAEFDSGDLVVALQDGGYEQGPRPQTNAVPEPNGVGMMTIALAVAAVSSTRRRHRRF